MAVSLASLVISVRETVARAHTHTHARVLCAISSVASRFTRRAMHATAATVLPGPCSTLVECLLLSYVRAARSFRCSGSSHAYRSYSPEVIGRAPADSRCAHDRARARALAHPGRTIEVLSNLSGCASRRAWWVATGGRGCCERRANGIP